MSAVENSATRRLARALAPRYGPSIRTFAPLAAAPSCLPSSPRNQILPRQFPVEKPVQLDTGIKNQLGHRQMDSITRQNDSRFDELADPTGNDWRMGRNLRLI